MHRLARLATLLFALPGIAHAVQVCNIGGQPVNPSNGNTTAGKTGLMRCLDGEGGALLREQEVRNGVFMGVVRYYRDGVLHREYQVNERGNRDGISREFAASGGGTNRLLREETLVDSTTVGRSRSWHADGKLKRVSFHDDKGRELAMAGFTPQGLLGELRCADRPLLAPDADDASLCGHQGGKPATVLLHSDSGVLRARMSYERGERRRSELLWDSGKLREQQEVSALGGVERSFSADGVKRRELHWVRAADDPRTRRITTLEQEFHESGSLVRERRFRTTERTTERGGELQLEQTWYLNGQPKDKNEFLTLENQAARRETHFHDNGRVAFTGLWLITPRSGAQASGVHSHFDAAGRLRHERHHDPRGRVSRERELDESGRVLRDDEVFEDGSRKAYSR